MVMLKVKISLRVMKVISSEVMETTVCVFDTKLIFFPLMLYYTVCHTNTNTE